MSKVLLKELCKKDEIGKYGIPASAEDFDVNKTRYLRISDIDDFGNLMDNDRKSVSADDIKKYILNDGDLVVARTGNSTGRTYFHEAKNGELAFAGFLIKYGLDEKKVIPKYLKYYTISNEYKQWVKNLSVGSTRGNINAQTFAACPIRLPKREQQENLVKVLSDLDTKIELNNRINRELEAMAKTLYDYWFVQFDFPNEQGKPYKSYGGKMVYNTELKREIPEGWEVKKLAKVTAVSNESVNPMLTPDQEFKHYSIPTYDSSKTYGIEKGIDIRSNKFVVTESDILVSKLNPWFSRVIYPIKEDDLICSTEFVVWRTSNTNIKNYLYMVGKGDHFVLHCSQSATGTSNSHKRVNPTVMMRYKIPFNSELIQKFGATINSWIKIGINKQIENKQLIELRDWLLPMLMNGQVTLKEAEERLSMAAESGVEYKKAKK